MNFSERSHIYRMEKIYKLLKIILTVGILAFLLSLVIYFFNLDMKAVAKIQPILDKHYDRIKQKKQTKETA